MRRLPRADFYLGFMVTGVLVAGGASPASAQQQRGPSARATASATVRASVTILEPVAVEAPAALEVSSDSRGRLSVDGAPVTRGRVPVSVHTSVRREPDRAGRSSPPAAPPAGVEPRSGDLRVTWTVAVIA